MKNNEVNILLNITNTLLKTTLEAYKYDQTSYYNHVIEEINKIITTIKHSDSDNFFILPKLKYNSYPTRSDLIKAISVLREIGAFLTANAGVKIEDLEELENEYNKLEKEIKELKEKEKDYIDIIKQSRGISGYSVSEDKISRFSGNNLKLINESLNAYSVGAYTACICVCRTILQDLIQKICKDNSIKEGSLEAQIKTLIDKKIIKEKHHSQLIDLAKFFGHRAAHPTTEVFTQEKANLILSSLFIINDELFSPSS